MESCEKPYNHDTDDPRVYVTISSIGFPEIYVSDINKIKFSLSVDEDDIFIEKIVEKQKFVDHITNLIEKQYEKIKDKNDLSENDFSGSPFIEYFTTDKDYIIEYDFNEIIWELGDIVKELDETKSYLDEMITFINTKYVQL